MKTYLNAFVGTSFLMTMLGAILVLGTYFTLAHFHVSHAAEVKGELIAVAVTMGVFVAIFPRIVSIERDLEKDFPTK